MFAIKGLKTLLSLSLIIVNSISPLATNISNLIIVGSIIYQNHHNYSLLPQTNILTFKPTQTPINLTPTLTNIAAKPTSSPTPIVEPSAPPTTPTLVISPSPTTFVASYTVVPGDTLALVALNLGVTVEDLIIQNQIIDPNHIEAGQILTYTSNYQPTINSNQKRILIDLSDQMLYAYIGNELVNQFIVSSGKPSTPTVTGKFKVYIKLVKAHMVGPDYDTDDVPYTMYFYESYGIHGAYWHNSFGTPVSHGCVNLRVVDSKWLYYWTPMYTPVEVQE